MDAMKLVNAISDRAQATNRPVMWASLTGDQKRLLNTVKPERDELFRVGELALFRGSSAAGGGGAAAGPGGIAGYGGDEIGPQSGTIPSSSLPVTTGSSTTLGGVCTYTSYGQAKIAYRQYRALAAQAKSDGKMALYRHYTLQWKCARNEMERLGAPTYEGYGYWGAYGDVCTRTQKWYNKRLAALEKWRENPPRLFADRRIARKERLVQTSLNKAIAKNCAWATEGDRQVELAVAAQEQQAIDAVMAQEYQQAQQQLSTSSNVLARQASAPPIEKPWVLVAALGGAGLLFAMVAVWRKRSQAG